MYAHTDSFVDLFLLTVILWFYFLLFPFLLFYCIYILPFIVTVTCVIIDLD